MRIFYFIIALFLQLFCCAQDPPVHVQQQLEDIADATENEIQDDDQYLQFLEHLKNHPININTVSIEELVQLRMLTPLQSDHLVRYRKLFGLFIDIHELQAIPYWDISTIHKTLPFLYAGPSITIKENIFSRLQGEHSLLLRMTRKLQASKGFDTSENNHYLGDRNQILFRYRYQFKDLLYFGIVGEKDAGEQFFKGAQARGFDFYSFHLFIRKLGWIKSLALGDYTVNLGQGLTQWHSFGVSKSSDVLNLKRQAAVIMPYRSAGEFLYYRGLAFTLQKGNFEGSFFISNKKTGASSGDSPGSFSNMITSGLYRNEKEISHRNKLVLSSVGCNISYYAKNFRLGVNLIGHRFSIAQEKKDEPYNHFSFSGSGMLNASMDLSYTHNNLHLFGEVATDKNGNLAILNSALVSVDPKIDVSILYRGIARNYQSLFGSAFTENTMPVNEQGIYAGISFKPGGSWQLMAYADFYRFPWLKYRVNAPSKGHDYIVQYNFKPSRQFELYLRYRTETKSINSPGSSVIPFPEGRNRQSLRFHCSGLASPAVNFKSRLEMMWYDRKGKAAEEGFLAFVEADFKKYYNWGANIRLQFFQTGGHNSRIYAYESDVLYSFSIPPSSNEGFRYYFNLNYKFNKKMAVWFKWSQSIYNKEVNETGSGLDMISGNLRSEVKLQCLYTF